MREDSIGIVDERSGQLEKRSCGTMSDESRSDSKGQCSAMALMEDLSLIPVASATGKGEASFIPIIISKSEASDALQSDETDKLLTASQSSKPLVQVDHQLTINSLKSLGLIDNNHTEASEDDNYRIPSWNAFALSDPNAQLTVKSITSVGLGSTDGRNLYVRRVPSSASILISNNYAIRRDPDGEDVSDGESTVSSTTSGYRFRRKHWKNKFQFLLACIGYTVGLGNVWRFPYMCYKSGGGAFLIPYFITLFVCAMPLNNMELAIGQFTRRGPVGAFHKICPLFRGTGIASLVISFIMSTYSIVIIAWALYYLVSSFNAELPWQNCNNDWNSLVCWDPSNASSLNSSLGTWDNRSSPTQEFYDRKVLQRSGRVDVPGALRGELILCLFFAWIFVYFALWKSVRSSGKVFYFTATVPYVFLIGLVCFSVTLPGADKGLRYFFRPKWDLLWDAKVWVNAAAQNFNSMGIAIGSMITFSSYNRFNNNIMTDTVAIGATNAITSIFMGTAVFALLGNIAHEQGTRIDDAVADGPGLVFVVVTSCLAKLPIPHAWSIIFFTMLLCIALDYEFAMVEVVVTAIRDGFPKFTEKWFKCHEVLVLVVCIISFLVGLPNVLQNGIFIFQLIDQYAAAYSLMYLAFFEMLAVIWIYGVDRLSRNIEEMTGNKPSSYFVLCWRYASPLLILILWVLSVADYEKPTYDNGKIIYPVWAEIVGWLIACSSLVCIPVFAVLQLRKSTGSTLLEKLKSSIQSLILECPKCNCTHSCTHDADGDSEWNLHRNSIKTTKLTPVIMSEAVFEKVSSL